MIPLQMCSHFVPPRSFLLVHIFWLLLHFLLMGFRTLMSYTLTLNAKKKGNSKLERKPHFNVLQNKSLHLPVPHHVIYKHSNDNGLVQECHCKCREAREMTGSSSSDNSYFE